jgi:coatomer protein complex subunit alpha (xenin)
MPKKGKAFIGYLIDKDYSSIALEMIDDKREKFSLAINSGQFQLAYDICNQLNNAEYWKILGEEALKQGIFNVVEVAYQKLQYYDKMSFLFLAQGT